MAASVYKAVSSYLVLSYKFTVYKLLLPRREDLRSKPRMFAAVRDTGPFLTQTIGRPDHKLEILNTNVNVVGRTKQRVSERICFAYTTE